jgi:hypothetical protein
MNIDELEGTELDELVAVKVMEWHKLPDDEWNGEMWYNTQNHAQFVTYTPSQYLSVAIFVIQKAIDDGLAVMMVARLADYTVEIVRPTGSKLCGRQNYHATAATLSLALCRALAKAYSFQ